MAAEKGHTKIVKLLLADKRVNPAADNNYAIRVAALKKGHSDSAVKLLLKDDRVDPAEFSNYAICIALLKKDIQKSSNYCLLMSALTLLNRYRGNHALKQGRSKWPNRNRQTIAS